MNFDQDDLFKCYLRSRKSPIQLVEVALPLKERMLPLLRKIPLVMNLPLLLVTGGTGNLFVVDVE